MMPVPNIELLVFDWDGTLVDSTHAITRAMQLAAADLDLPVPSRERASHVIGLGMDDALAYAVPDLGLAQRPAFVDRYRHHYVAHSQALAPFEAVPLMLEELRASPIPVAVATGKSRAGLSQSLLDMDWHRHFVSTRCADEGLPKPNPWMLQDLAEEMGVPLDRVLMVGDTTHDLAMARAAGSLALGVTYGAHSRQALGAEPSVRLIDSSVELHSFITKIVNRSGGGNV